MAATVQIRSWHGAGAGGDGGGASPATIRFRNSDVDTQDGSNQVAIPGGGGTNYSYIKQLRLHATVAPTTSIANIKFYMTGTAVTGIDVRARTQAAYTDPTVNASTQLTGTVSGYTLTAAVPMSVGGSLGASTGAAGDYVQLQMAVISTATAGVKTLGNFILRWDEM